MLRENNLKERKEEEKLKKMAKAKQSSNQTPKLLRASRKVILCWIKKIKLMSRHIRCAARRRRNLTNKKKCRQV